MFPLILHSIWCILLLRGPRCFGPSLKTNHANKIPLLSSPLLSCPGFGKLDLTLRMNRALSKMATITQTLKTGIWHLFTFLRYLNAWCWCQSWMSVWRRPKKCKFCCARMWTFNKWFYWPQIPWIGVKFGSHMELGPEMLILGVRPSK